MKISGAGLKSDVAGVLLDVVESWDGFSTINAPATFVVPGENRGAAPLALVQTGGFGPAQIFGAAIAGGGGNPTAAFDAVAGAFIVTIVSQAVAERGLAGSGTISGSLRMPLNQRFGAGTIPIPFRRPLRQYTFRVPVRLSAHAGGPAFVGVTDGQNGNGGGMPAFGYGWCADTGLNAGRWTARFRQTILGAITTVGDSGIVALGATWHELGIRFTEGAVPTVEWLMDGVPAFQVSGDANMPTLNQGLGPWCCLETLPVVGTTMLKGSARFTVREIGA